MPTSVYRPVHGSCWHQATRTSGRTQRCSTRSLSKEVGRLRSTVHRPDAIPLRDSDGRIWFTIDAPTLLPVGRAAGRLPEQSCNSSRSAGRDSVRFHLSARYCASSRCWARRPSRLQIGSRHSARSDAALGRADDGRGQSACQRHAVTTTRWSSSTIATVTGSSRVR